MIDLDLLRRHPDLEAPGLQATDAADRLILDEAGPALADAAHGEVVVIDDAYGALALGAVGAGARGVRVHQDPITGERALAENAVRVGVSADDRPLSRPLEPQLVAGARVVLMRLPRSLDRLDQVAELIAVHAAADVRVFAGGRIKHMSLAMNDVLANRFARVDVTHARQKSRVLVASGALGPTSGARPSDGWPRRAHDEALGLTIVAHGGVFAGAAVDIGTRFLLDVLDDAVPDAATAVDLACGSGVVATWLARRRPEVVVRASDRSAAAAASAALTADANGVADRVEVARADALEHLPDTSERLVVLNPPFHSDAAVHTGIATHLFADAARVLEPGGELWCVWNSHLRYRPLLERLVGPTRQVARNPKFTVTASTR
ncbi:16S rRNA (guanine1207-N2)-methyltransferase [Agromyces flavus]|uniref:16S rRNA (Guanine1207-N2)-methyltransferase n=1 Tax=Agromyces flavus TaxID=589382 RepID=A0A1H1ZC82_9MICO|nr:methyltransferase [Agromyces flavus]MCP2367019.1 16S rRNA (guanine1207-N2)-methyltransferase [Agromyces flavus]GGI46562.1 16S RNA G1207 methylase RsmC [Agromyces flavus]SDT31167.1 16S rRNA (guanine1207-N2)-methyltransferase [Agromyces flavus]